VEEHAAVFLDDRIGNVLRVAESALAYGFRLQLDCRVVIAEMHRDRLQAAGREERLGKYVLARMLFHEVAAAPGVHGAVDLPRP